MKKFIITTILILGIIASVFAEETDNTYFYRETDDTYWYREDDVNGRLTTYYFCKTDTQFNNVFKDLVKEQLGLEYSTYEPNWNSFLSGWISKEGIRKNYPKYYKSIMSGDWDNLDWDNYKYCWTILCNSNGAYFVVLFKRVNGTVYLTLNAMYNYQWSYTNELLDLWENGSK